LLLVRSDVLMLANRPVRVMELQDGRGKNPSISGKELITVAVLGLILLAAAGVLTAAVVTSNTDSLSVSLWSVDVSNVTLGVVFVAGHDHHRPRGRGSWSADGCVAPQPPAP
jgi:hypothetical protein